MIQRNNENSMAVIKQILVKYTHRSGVFETLNLMLAYLPKVSLPVLVKLFDDQNEAPAEIETHIKNVIS